MFTCIVDPNGFLNNLRHSYPEIVQKAGDNIFTVVYLFKWKKQK